MEHGYKIKCIKEVSIMKEIFINNSIKEKVVDKEEIRVKALLINSKNEILLGYSYHTYQFPGGHLEKGESIKDCLKREILEETGMDISLNMMRPLLSIKYYNKNCCEKIYYYVINTDEKVNLRRTNYTKEEKLGNYVLRYINMEDIEDVLIEHSSKYQSQKVIAYEMLMALKEYKNKEL